jgi:regulator of replication initiation timing
MVEAVFTEEDKKNLKTVVEEVPKLRLELESLKETLEILSCEGVLERLAQSKKDFAEGHVYTHEEMLKELGIDEEEV